ncbi:MAG: tetratricopeptide repeat protein [Bacteroidota bacterium]
MAFRKQSKSKFLASLVFLTFLVSFSFHGHSQGAFGTVANYNFDQIGRHIEERQYQLARNCLESIREIESISKQEPFGHFQEWSYYHCLEAAFTKSSNAERLILNFLSAHPFHLGASKLRFALALLLITEGRLEEALELMELVNWYLLTSDQAQQFLFFRGELIKPKNLDLAIKIWEQAASIEGEFSSHAHYSLALAHIDLNRPKVAMVHLGAIQKVPSYLRIWEYPYTLCLIRNGDTSQAYQFIDSLGVDSSIQQAIAICQLGWSSAYRQDSSHLYQKYLRKGLELKYMLSPLDTLHLAQMLSMDMDWDSVTVLLRNVENWHDSLKVSSYLTAAKAWLKLAEQESILRYKDKAKVHFQRVIELADEGLVREKSFYLYSKLCYEIGAPPTNFRALAAFLEQYPQSEYRDEISEYISQLALQGKNYRSSLNLLRAVPKKSNKIISIIQQLNYLQGITFFNQQRYTESLAYLDSVLMPGGDSLWQLASMFWKSELYHRLGEYNQAHLWMKNFLDKGLFNQKLTDLGCTELVACYQLGHLSYNLNKPSQATVYWNRCIKVGRNLDQRSEFDLALYRDAHLRLGDAYLKNSQIVLAIEQFGKCIHELRVGVEYAHYQLGIAYGINKDFNLKRKELSLLINEYPESDYKIYALLELALTCYHESSFDSALMCSRILEEEFPDHRLTIYGLNLKGSIYVARGADSLALQVFEKVIERSSGLPEARDALYEIRQLCIRNNLPDQYWTIIEKNNLGSVQDDNRDTLLYEMAMNSFHSGRYSECKTTFGRYISTYPKGAFLADALFYKALSAEKLDDKESMIEDLRKILILPNNLYSERSMLQLAVLYQGMDSTALALEVFKKLEFISFSELTRFEAALGQVRCATRLSYWSLADSVCMRNLAISKLSNSHRNELQWHSANSKRFSGRKSMAIHELKTLADSSSLIWSARALYDLAQIEFDDKKYDSAEDYIYQLEERFPQYPDWVGKSLLLLCDISLLRGQKYQATLILSKIIDTREADEVSREAARRLLELQTP